MTSAVLDPRLRCPPPGRLADRVPAVLSGLADWVRQEPLLELFDLFELPVPDGWAHRDARSVLDDLRSMNPWQQRGSLWDYRGAAEGRGEAADDGVGGHGAARLHGAPPVLGAAADRRILELATELGLDDGTVASHDEYDLVVSLAGLRLSCRARTAWLAHQLEEQGVRARAIAVLGSRRPVQPAERRATDSYAEGAVDEFDLMVCGAVAAGLLNVGDLATIRHPPSLHADPMQRWVVHTYPGRFGAEAIHLVAAPSADPGQSRPDTATCLRFMLDQPEAAEAQRILLVGSASSAPYQQVEAMRVAALPRNLTVETIGVPPAHARVDGGHRAHTFLQEIRSTFQASLRLDEEHGAAV